MCVNNPLCVAPYSCFLSMSPQPPQDKVNAAVSATSVKRAFLKFPCYQSLLDPAVPRRNLARLPLASTALSFHLLDHNASEDAGTPKGAALQLHDNIGPYDI